MEEFLSSVESSPGYVLNNISFNRYDAGLFSGLVASDEALAGLVRGAGAGGDAPHSGAPPTFAALLFDLFLAYFKFSPEFVGEKETHPDCLRANRPILKRLLDEEETMLTRLVTATDATASALAATETAKRLLDELGRRPDLFDWMRRESSDPGPPAAELGATARAAAAAGSAEAERHVAALASWGLKAADLSRVPLGERLGLARALRTKRVRDLADLLGRMKNQRTSERRRKVRANRDEIHEIGTSGDIARAMPSELASAFGTGEARREMDFFRRLSEHSVPSYSLRTHEPVGRGPVVALIDTSYSMSGEPMAWASALALTLAQAATRQASARTGARPVTAIFFNTQIALEVALEAGERDPRKFLSVATVAADGGTDYDRPLSRAMEILEGGAGPKRARARQGKGAFSDSDVLLITDGRCKLGEAFAPEFARRKAALGCALVCVLVGEHATTGSLEPHADRLVAAADLARASGRRDAASRVFDAL
jgi:uncharacterized protein with von Willebrand factor type A (vWA) domain